MKSLILTGSALLALAATPAIAKEKVDPRIKSALSCAAMTDPQQRLQCYDTAVAGLRQALEAGQLVTPEEIQRPYAMEGVVSASGPMGFNRFWVNLDTGDRWDVLASGPNDEPPRKGTKVKIAKGALSGFWFRERNTPDRRAKYLGRD